MENSYLCGMLGMFTLLMCVVIGKVVYEICLHLLKRFRGNKASNTTISIILAVALALGYDI